jgi:hypothetical protein
MPEHVTRHGSHEERKTKHQDSGPHGEKGDARRDEHGHHTGQTRSRSIGDERTGSESNAESKNKG